MEISRETVLTCLSDDTSKSSIFISSSRSLFSSCGPDFDSHATNVTTTVQDNDEDNDKDKVASNMNLDSPSFKQPMRKQVRFLNQKRV